MYIEIVEGTLVRLKNGNIVKIEKVLKNLDYKTFYSYKNPELLLEILIEGNEIEFILINNTKEM